MTAPSALADAHSAIAITQAAHEASLQLSQRTERERRLGLQTMSRFLAESQTRILEANTLDLEISREMAVPEVLQDWLKLTPERLQRAIDLLEIMGEAHDPVLHIMPVCYAREATQTYGQLMPLGVVALVYEMFPELAAIAAGLCLQTGNVLILRGSAEADHTNTAIAQILQEAIAEHGLPAHSLIAISAEQGISIQDLVAQDQHLNLVIPYGRANFVQQVVQWTAGPVLRTAIGNCCLYYAPNGDVDLARQMILDSHVGVPEPVNAIEKVLLHHSLSAITLVRLFAGLQEAGFELRGEHDLALQFPDFLKPISSEQDWQSAYLRKIVAFRCVDDLGAAIAWINQFSSNHADCLVTQSYHESQQFAQAVNSAQVYINASPRFSRNPKRSNAVFLGMSNQKGQRRGRIGVESLMTFNQVIQGQI
ncbi:MAG: glutamate-5-semialdehyde dehydrogenase [Spirulina sp. SIO3F2]|nr:glutamate-5-semialdehyde dehydrogenase [Spirulina sp. SIO3F2]